MIEAEWNRIAYGEPVLNVRFRAPRGDGTLHDEETLMIRDQAEAMAVLERLRSHGEDPWDAAAFAFDAEP